MYIGSTDSRGLMHCLWEIFDNAVDEALGGHCTTIDVVLNKDLSAEVRDNGRGIPVDIEPKSGLPGVELVMTRLHAGGKFGGGSYTASGGLHGVGASVVNALSARLDVHVDREGHEWAASFRRGVPGEFAADGPGARSPPGPGCGRPGRWPGRSPGPGSGSGRTSRCSPRTRAGASRPWCSGPGRPPTWCRAWPSGSGTSGRPPITAPASPDVAAEYPDHDPGTDGPREAEFRFDGGISEFCAYLAPGEPPPTCSG